MTCTRPPRRCLPSRSALAAATALAVLRGRMLPPWYGWASATTALVTIFRGGALAHGGFYAPGGGYGSITFIVILIWVLATSGVLILRGPATASG